MKTKAKKFNKKLVLLFLILAILFTSILYRNWQSKFEAPRKDTPTIQFMISKDKTLQAIIGDLKYYDFIKDEEAFTFALEHTQDNKHGGENTIKVGKGSKTIDREAVYKISQSMTAWEIADVLLNQGDYQSCNHGCPESNFIPELLPGGDLAPTLKEKYSWVETYEDCVKAVGTGHEGGQISSEQNHVQTGLPRVCTSPDGRYFTEGKEGYADYPQQP